MKISKQLKKQKTAEGTSGNQRGVALVLVLTVMSLATIMVLSFFSLATSENEASATYSRGLQAQQVAEQAVNMVIAQVRKATSEKGAGWASQPGALRVWESNGNFKMGYKLYSDDLMQEPDEDKLNDTDFEEVQDWTSRPEEFVDLNEPVIRGEKVYFPIVDPLARDLPEWPSTIGGEDDDKGVEGFDFNFDDDHTINPGGIEDAIKEVNNVGHLPMPVRWIYQLADGTLGTLSGSSFTSFYGNAIPDEDNQIVGRFAFWADDESVKLNINTHAGGLAWDTPRAGGDMDMDMGKYQPLQKEWQRYPGHPATTHLAPALAPGVLDIVRNKVAMEMIFKTVPRIVGGGSESGTRKANPRDSKEREGLIPDKNPLFPSVDEYVMAPDRKPNYFPRPNGMPTEEDEMVEMVERLRFFLTTSSRSPETTIFNTPRVACWPITGTGGGKYKPKTDKRMTAFDGLIAFCSTLGGEEYFFRRMDSDSPSYDMYHADMERNPVVYNYLAKLMDSNLPGIGAAFSDKYGKIERYQLLTQIFDYIRSTNLHDDSLFGKDWEDAFEEDNTDDHITYTNPRKKNPEQDVIGAGGIHRGHGQVTPIEVKEGGITTKGFGRFYTLKDVATHVICCADGGDGNLKKNFIEALGGRGIGARNPGFKVYPNRSIERDDQGEMYSNFPPMAAGVSLNVNDLTFAPPGKDPEKLWPEWLTDWMDSYLNHEDEWTEIGTASPPPLVPPQTRSTRIPKGNWRDRLRWRESDNPRDAVGNQANWQEVVDIIKPAFEAANWNWNLKFNRLDGNDNWIPVEVHEGGDGNDDDNTLYSREDIGMKDKMSLGPKEKLVQAAMVFNLFCPSMGWAPIVPDMSMRVDLKDYGSSDGFFKFVSLGAGGGCEA